MSLQAMWKGMTDVAGSREGAMMGLKKAFGQYNYAEDPEYQRDMQFLQQNPTQQVAGAFVEKWGDQLDGVTMENIAKQLQPLEGTNQWYQNQMNDIQLSNAELGLDYNQYAQPYKKENLQYQTQQNMYNTDIAQNKAKVSNQVTPSSIEAQIAQNRYNTEQAQAQMPYVEDLARLGFEQDQARLDSMLGQNEMLQHELDIMNQTKDYRIDNARLQNLSNQLGVDAQTIENYILDQTKQDRIDQSAAQLERILLGNENQRTNNMINRETAQAQINRPYIANSGAILANNYQTTQNRILNENADNMITQSDLETELLRLQQQQAKDEYNFMKGLDDNLRFGVNTGNGGPAIDIKEVLPTPEGVPQLALNSADTVVYLDNGLPYVDESGKSYVATTGIMGSNRVFKAVDPNSYLSGGSDESDFRKTGDGNDEQNSIISWIQGQINNVKNNVTGGGDNQTQQQSGSAQELYQQFKQNTPTDEPLTPSQIKQRISLIDDERFEQMYGIPKSQFEDFLNRF